MNNATRLTILFTLLVPLGLMVHAADAPWVIAQGGLPGQLPGQRLPGQLPGSSAAPTKPTTATSPPTPSAPQPTGAQAPAGNGCPVGTARCPSSGICVASCATCVGALFNCPST